MSIILEALKKASDKPSFRPETKPTHDLPAASPVPPEVHDTRISKSLVIMVSAVAVIAAVSYFTGVTRQGPAAKPSAPALSAASPAAEKAVEGYSEPTPISNMMTKLSNPRLTLNGIVFGIGKPAAIIENKIFEEGDLIRGMKVVKIYSDRVEMLDQATGQPFVLRVD